MKPSQLTPGEVVHVIVRNPHVQGAAHIQQAAVIQDPDHPDRLALFMHQTVYPLTDEVALFRTPEEAEEAYQAAFGHLGEPDHHG